MYNEQQKIQFDLNDKEFFCDSKRYSMFQPLIENKQVQISSLIPKLSNFYSNYTLKNWITYQIAQLIYELRLIKARSSLFLLFQKNRSDLINMFQVIDPLLKDHHGLKLEDSIIRVSSKIFHLSINIRTLWSISSCSYELSLFHDKFEMKVTLSTVNNALIDYKNYPWSFTDVNERELDILFEEDCMKVNFILDEEMINGDYCLIKLKLAGILFHTFEVLREELNGLIQLKELTRNDVQSLNDLNNISTFPNEKQKIKEDIEKAKEIRIKLETDRAIAQGKEYNIQVKRAKEERELYNQSQEQKYQEIRDAFQSNLGNQSELQSELPLPSILTLERDSELSNIPNISNIPTLSKNNSTSSRYNSNTILEVTCPVLLPVTSSYISSTSSTSSLKDNFDESDINNESKLNIQPRLSSAFNINIDNSYNNNDNHIIINNNLNDESKNNNDINININNDNDNIVNSSFITLEMTEFLNELYLKLNIGTFMKLLLYVEYKSSEIPHFLFLGLQSMIILQTLFNINIPSISDIRITISFSKKEFSYQKDKLTLFKDDQPIISFYNFGTLEEDVKEFKKNESNLTHAILYIYGSICPFINFTFCLTEQQLPTDNPHMWYFFCPGIDENTNPRVVRNLLFLLY